MRPARALSRARAYSRYSASMRIKDPKLIQVPGIHALLDGSDTVELNQVKEEGSLNEDGNESRK